MITVTLLLLLASTVVGIAVLLANPDRNTNRAIAIQFLLGAVWLLFVYQIIAEAQQPIPSEARILLWSQLNAAVAALLPWSIWLLKASILNPHTAWPSIIKRSFPWLIASLSLATLCFLEDFAHVETRVHRGPLYLVFHILLLFLWTLLLIDGIRHIRQQTGVRRMEMQFVVFIVTISCMLMIVLNVVGNLLHVRSLNRASIIILCISILIMAWAITYHKIYNVRDLIASLAQRVFIILSTIVFVVLLEKLFSPSFLGLSEIAFAVTATILFTLYLDRQSQLWLHSRGTVSLLAIRREVMDLAGRNSDPTALRDRFEELLRQGFGCTFAKLHLADVEAVEIGQLHFRGRDAVSELLSASGGWATPESLERRKLTPTQNELRTVLRDTGWGAVVMSPVGSVPPSLFIALGQKTDGWLFTFPEIERLLNVAELMDNILTHARLSAQAAMTAKIEFLTMMSRGLAHDLRNLITPISSFLIHAERRHEMDPEEAEVHAAASRSVRSMDEYVRQAVLYSEQLALRLATVNLQAMFDTVRLSCTDRAAARGVILLVRCDHEPITADAVLLQRLLTNLVNNAIDASPHGQSVALSAEPLRPGWVRFTVSDHGCGIPAEHRGRIFEPYFTTKQYGGDIRGFGLGLTICRKISDLHGGVIEVSSEIDAGTTFTVDLPVTQEASGRPDAAAPA